MVKVEKNEGLVDQLKNLEPFLYFPSSGNAGDALISHATFEYFRHHGIQYQIFTEERYRFCRRVVIGGGGGFVDGYTKMANLVNRLCLDVESVLILPSSVKGYESVIRLMDSRFHFIARESISAMHVKQHANGAMVSSYEDMAFTLDVSTMPRPERLPFLLLGQPLHYQMKWLSRYFQMSHLLQYVPEMTFFLRQDAEALFKGGDWPRGNVDLSHRIKGKMDREDRAASLAQVFLGIISRQKFVVTDRLHIAIACGLLQIPCEMRSNNYHKNRCMYEESIKNRFPCVAFSG
jgi:exopolysaccharide biosynthesis predicted pyruvyltransferase EpsI